MVKKRIDTAAPRTALTDTPFAKLGGAGPAPEAAPQPPAPKAAPVKAAAYRVAKTRKGGWPLSIEKRSGGKIATIIGQVEGDGEALLTALKKRCAAGGVFRDGRIELQGDQREKVERFLGGD
jgi:translation initiation factor 1 (eIF-1/SUI1)